MSGTNDEPERKALAAHLGEAVQALGDRESLPIVEFGADGLVSWRVRRNEVGTARARYWPTVPWTELFAGGVLSEERFRLAAQADESPRACYVLTAPDHAHAARAAERFRGTDPMAAIFRCVFPLAQVLGGVLAQDPLTQWYDLVVLRRTSSGRLVLGSSRLFPPGARPGYSEAIKIRCALSDDNGTAFAVVARKSKERRYRRVSVHSARLPPGSYEPTAVLRRPGLVSFLNLPAPLHDDDRAWQDLVGAVPERLQLISASHLICLIEICGNARQIELRLDRIAQFIRMASRGDCQLAVSLVTYGPHSIERGVPDCRPLRLVTAESGESALSALSTITVPDGETSGFRRAAQLECALAEAADSVNVSSGRPVVVTVGRRVPFPPRVDLSEIPPCPRHRDWRLELQRLRDFPGAAFGAIREDGPENEAWNQLGQDATARLDPAFSAERFAADLGLITPIVEYIPFPLHAAEEG